MDWLGIAVGLGQVALGVVFLSQRHRLAASSGKGTTRKVSARFYTRLGLFWLLLAAGSFAVAL